MRGVSVTLGLMSIAQGLVVVLSQLGAGVLSQGTGCGGRGKQCTGLAREPEFTIRDDKKSSEAGEMVNWRGLPIEETEPPTAPTAEPWV